MFRINAPLFAPLRLLAAIAGSMVWLLGALIFGGDDPAELR